MLSQSNRSRNLNRSTPPAPPFNENLENFGILATCTNLESANPGPGDTCMAHDHVTRSPIFVLILMKSSLVAASVLVEITGRKVQHEITCMPCAVLCPSTSTCTAYTSTKPIYSQIKYDENQLITFIEMSADADVSKLILQQMKRAWETRTPPKHMGYFEIRQD